MPRKSGRGGPLRRAPPRRGRGRRARGRRARAINHARATELVVRLIAADADVTDLVERLEGPERRFGDRTLGVLDNAPIEEWKLKVGVQELLQMLHPDSTHDVADRLLRFFVDGDESALRVVWLNDAFYVVCESLHSPQPEYNPHVFKWGVVLDCSELRKNSLRLWGAAGGVRPEPELLRVLHRLVGRSTIIYTAGLELGYFSFADEVPPGVEDVVSLTRTSRYVYCSPRVTPETGRALVNSCNPLVDLSAELDRWDDHGAALIEAMVANRCPAKLTLSDIPDGTMSTFAAALAATTSLEELDLTVRSMSRDAEIVDAIGRNHSIRSLTVVMIGRLTDANETEFLWESVSKSSTIQSIHAWARIEFFEPITYDDGVRRDCAELVAKHMRNNKQITCLECDPTTHDAEVMLSQVAPIVRLNRFRPVVNGLSNGPGGMEGRAKRVLGLLASPLVRRHPELRYFLLKKNGDILLLPSPTPVVVEEEETQDPVALATARFLVDRYLAREGYQATQMFDDSITRMTRPAFIGLERFNALLQARIDEEEGVTSRAQQLTQLQAEELSSNKEALPQRPKEQSEQKTDIVEATASHQTEQIDQLLLAATGTTNEESYSNTTDLGKTNGWELGTANHETNA